MTKLSYQEMVQIATTELIKIQPTGFHSMIEQANLYMPGTRLRAILSIFFDYDNKRWKSITGRYRKMLSTLNTHFQKLPKYGATNNTPISERIVYLHYSVNGSDWWIWELDTGAKGEYLLFGITVNRQHPEITLETFISLDELISDSDATLDELFHPKPIKYIPSLKNLCSGREE